MAIPLDEVSKDFHSSRVTTLSVLTIPLELCNAPQTMKRLMEKIILGQLCHQIFVFNLDEYLLLLSEVALYTRREHQEKYICHEGDLIFGAHQQ